MNHWINIIGLLFTVVGASIAIKGTLTTSASRIKQRWSDIEEAWKNEKPSWIYKLSCHIAKTFGSDDPLDTEDYITETFISNFWAFTMMLLGFVLQAIAILASVGVFSCSGTG